MRIVGNAGMLMVLRYGDRNQGLLCAAGLGGMSVARYGNVSVRHWQWEVGAWVAVKLTACLDE